MKDAYKLRPIPEVILQRARLSVAAHAADADEASEFLEMLGIHPVRVPTDSTALKKVSQ